MDISKNILKILRNKKIEFFVGVPDSVLKNFSNALSKLSNKKHIIGANEGGAVSLAVGYHLATKNSFSLSSKLWARKYYKSYYINYS